MPRRRKKKRATEEINSSSMADIAFLLLIFFLVTTTVLNEKGIWFTLPKKKDKDAVEQDDQIKKRNMLTVILNSNNKILMGAEEVQMNEVKDRAIAFIDNKGRDENLSQSPKDAIVTFRADRGTDAQTYIYVLDALLASYTELKSDHVGITAQQYLKLDKSIPEHEIMMKKAEKEYPFKFSEAKPSGEK